MGGSKKSGGNVGRRRGQEIREGEEGGRDLGDTRRCPCLMNDGVSFRVGDLFHIAGSWYIIFVFKVMFEFFSFTVLRYLESSQ